MNMTYPQNLNKKEILVARERQNILNLKKQFVETRYHLHEITKADRCTKTQLGATDAEIQEAVASAGNTTGT